MPSHLAEFFKAPEKSDDLRKFIKEIFKVGEFTAFTHSVENEVVGLFVILTNSREDFLSPHSRALSLKKVFDLAYKMNVTLKEKHALDISDPLTGLLNRRHFSKKLEEEISRARRIVMPLSLITIDCDRFHEINEKIGFQQADTILKVIAAVLKKTTRVSDVIARTGPDEFTLLLPHTGQTGAAIKAERLRLLIQSTKFPILGSSAGSLTVSCGVSEYPSLSSDGEGLLRSADDALAQVRKTGNRVCVATVLSDFKLDFIPREVSAEDSAIKR